MKPKLQAQIAKAQQQALGQVAAAESSQSAAVQGHVASVQGQVRARAAAMKGQVTSAHTAAIAKINATHRDAEQKLTQAKTKALADAGSAESLALIALAADFLGLKGRFTALGSRKAGDAITVGEEESGKMSGQWDGEKLEAAQKAARETADGFASSMAGQASAKYGEIEANKPQAEQSLRDLAKTTRDNIDKAYDSAKQSIDAAKQSSTQAADAARTAALSQIDQACASTVAQLGAHGASQVAAIRQQAQGARTGITAAGQAARAGVTQACDRSASGIEKGVAGLIRGAKQIEAPNPEAAQEQVAQGAQGLERGAGDIARGLSDTAGKSSLGLAEQATGAAEGMASAAAAAKAAATQMGAAAQQQMSAIATGTGNSLAQVAEAHKTTTDGTVTAATTGFTEQVTALGSSYEQAATTRATELENNYKACEGGLNQAVPDRGGGGGGAGSGKQEEGGGEGGGGAAKGEVESIQENAQKAADAVKPWWQKALAVVVSIIVAVVVVIVVTALVVTTGPIGAILVGAAAGALASVAGTMASNLVLGNGLFDGITWKTVLVGAIGGGLGAGLTAGLGAGASALAGSARFAGTALGRGAQATSTAMSGTASTLGQFAIKTGVGIGTDFVSEQTANLIVNQKLDISVENLVLSVVTNAATSHAKFDAFQNTVQSGIQARTPINVNLPRLQLQIGGPPTPTGAHGGGGTGGAGGDGAGVSPTPGTGAGASPTPGPGTGASPTPRPAGDGGGGTTPRPDADGGATPRPGGDGNGATPRPAGDGSGTTPRPGDGGATPRPGDGGATPRPDGGGATPRPDGDGATPRPGDGGTTPRPGDGATPRPDGDGATPRPDGDGATPRPDGDGATPRSDGDGATPRSDGDGATPRPDGDGATPRSDGDGATPRPGADDANGPRRPGADGGSDGPRRPGADGDTDGPRRPGADGGSDGPTRADGDGGDGPTRSDGPTDESTPEDAATAARDSELGDLGYPEGTRAKVEELAGRIEQGDVPPKDAVRDTEANQRGLDELQQLQNDPNLTPEQKAQLERDIAARVREQPEPTGNLPRDIQEARAHTQEQNGNQENPDTGASGGISDPNSSYRGDAVGRDNSHNVNAGVQEALPNLGSHFAPNKVRQTGPDKIEIDIDGTPTEVRIEVVPKDQLASPTDVANFDLSTTPPTIRVSGNAKKQHVERALAHEVAEITSILEARSGSGPARGTDNALGWDSTSQKLSHDDVGRLAELRVLMADLNNPSRPKAETKAEMQALLRELGLVNTDGTALNTGGLGGQRRALIEAEGIRIDDVSAALGLTPGRAPRTDNDGLPLRGDHADPDAVPRQDVTYDEVDAKLPPELADALSKFGLSRETVVRYIVEHHNNRSRQRYLPDLEGLARQYAPNGLTPQDVMVIDLYTTKLYYKELNSRLRTGRDVDSTEHLQALLNDALSKLPPVAGAEFYRSINLEDGHLAAFLAQARVGTLKWDSFNSVASDIDGTFPSDNVLFVIRNGTARDISDFGDGIHYKDPANPGRELLMEGGVEFRVTNIVEETKPDGTKRYRIELEPIPPPSTGGGSP